MAVYMDIDVAKRNHQVMVMDVSGNCLVKAFPVTNDRAGIDALLDRLVALDEPVEIGLEATGHYWLALFEQLTAAGADALGLADEPHGHGADYQFAELHDAQNLSHANHQELSPAPYPPYASRRS